MGRAPGQMDATAGDLDEEQHVYALEPDGVDREEIHGDDALRLCAQELTPRWPFAPASGTELFLAQDVPDRRCGYTNAEALELAHNALISRARVLVCQPNDDGTNLTTNRRATRASGVRPPTRHQAAVPVQQRGRRDEKRRPLDARKHSAGRRQKEPVCRPKRRSAELATQHCQLVAKHHDLEFLELRGPTQQTDQLQSALEHDVECGEHGTSPQGKCRYSTQSILCTPHSERPARDSSSRQRIVRCSIQLLPTLIPEDPSRAALRFDPPRKRANARGAVAPGA